MFILRGFTGIADVAAASQHIFHFRPICLPQSSKVSSRGLAIKETLEGLNLHAEEGSHRVLCRTR